MCQLRSDLDASVEARRKRTLPLQRLRSLLQNERHQPAAREAKAKNGKSMIVLFFGLDLALTKFATKFPIHRFSSSAKFALEISLSKLCTLYITLNT